MKMMDMLDLMARALKEEIEPSWKMMWPHVWKMQDSMISTMARECM